MNYAMVQQRSDWLPSHHNHRNGEERAMRAGNGARVGHCEDDCPLCRPGDGEGDARRGTGQTIVPLTAPGTAKGTIAAETTNACGVVG